MDLGNSSQTKLNELLKVHDHIYNHLYSFVKPMSLKCAVQLGIPDAIHNHQKPMSLDELSPVLSIHPEKAQFLPQLMRILTHMGYFLEHTRADGVKEYELTQASELLLRDHPYTTRPYLLSMLDPNIMNPWHSLSSWLQCSEPDPFAMANGMPIWEYAGREVQFNSEFNQAMASDSRIIASVLDKHEEWKGLFDRVRSFVDVGGGSGEMAKAIATAFPHINCTVLDLPHVVDGLQGTNNLAYVAGDMFQAVPPTDTVLLKWILHDWNDEESVKIMKRCRKAITSNDDGRPGKVIIIDAVVDSEHDKDNELRETQLFYDMEMLVLVKAKERTEREWKKLFEDAGFMGGYKIHSVLGIRSLIVVYPCVNPKDRSSKSANEKL